jgi:uncharacterized MAPEG superfamily protein
MSELAPPPDDAGRPLQAPPSGPSADGADTGARGRQVIRCVVALMLYRGFTLAILGTGSPWIARSFGLDQSGIARTFAWASLSAYGALAAYSSVALLAVLLGGLSTAVGYLAICGLPGAVLYSISIDETRGMTLEAAAGEAAAGENPPSA